MSSISIDCLFKMDEIIDINAAKAPVIRKSAVRTVNGNVVVLLQLYTDDLEGTQKMINQIQKELLIKVQKI